MNRRQRRAAAKQPSPIPPASAVAPPAYLGKPGLLLRLFAGVLLSKWVLNRVQHPDVRRALASLAVQAGRTDVLEDLRTQDPA